MTVGVVFIPGLRKTSDETPLGNGFVFTVVSPTSRSTSSLKQKCVSDFHDEIPKTSVAFEAFLGISSVLIPEPTIKKVEISSKHSHNEVPAFHRIRILITSLTYLLTPRSRVLLEKLTVLQLVKKFPAFYGTRRFITALTSARHLSLS
jgi:hypothetical protein